MDDLSRDKIIDIAQTDDTALIYSISELNEYLVEVFSADSIEYLRKGNQILKFQSVNDAVRGAKHHGAKNFYLCIDNTYDECGSMTPQESFSYLSISPNGRN
ncbi:MAG TPA: hypothetical protein PK657_05045 [Legionella sp.]|nr:hypothetical protein [Legionella sp.]